MKKLMILSVLFFLSSGHNVNACTNFQVKAKDNTVVIGRTMEFPTDLKSKIWVIPRGLDHTSIGDKGVKGISWKNKYAFIGIDAFNLGTVFVEGMNEKGLATGGLMFTGAKYQEAKSGNFIAYTDLLGWLLGSFATVQEVKKELPKIKVVDKYLKELKGSLGLHVAIHDATGDAIVVEFINGEQRIYDNKVGVLTNRPDFNWQLTNLRNYINLDRNDKEPKTVSGLAIEPTGVGSGMLGLPGDWTPPSRFVKVAYSLDAAIKPKNSQEAINLAEHIMNSVDIPKGAIKEKVDHIITLYGYAQWSIIKDLKDQALYFRTYDNMTLKKVDLKKINITEGAKPKSIPMTDNYVEHFDASGLLK